MFIFEDNDNLNMPSSIFFLCLLMISLDTFAQSTFIETGTASYYADKFNGRKTASGSIFNNSALTAAHKKLPFGTVLKVTNIENDLSVVVTVNDRGPYAHGRVIDLSKAAAIQLDMIKKGLAEVRIEEVKQEIKELSEEMTINQEAIEVISIWETPRNVIGYGVQLSSFESKESALVFSKEAYNKGVELPLIKIHNENNKTYYRVMAGEFNDQESASDYMKQLKKIGYKGFVKSYR